MERNEFLKLCQRASVQPNGVNGKVIIDKELIVSYKGIKFYPVSYSLWFDNGVPKHTATLHDLKSKTRVDVPLDKVEKEELCKEQD